MSTEKNVAPEEKETQLSEQGTTELSSQVEAPMGFEDEEQGDMIIPRVKVVQTLSPERKDKIATEGDIINTLTHERLNGKKFIPVFKFNNNIDWIDRNDGGGIRCIARDGKVGKENTGRELMCKVCKKCEFDNTKQGREAIPSCTKYINFFGFFEGDRMPIILSFGKTNYNEGKKLYSLAKVQMQNMWNFGYTLTEKIMAKNGNEWYIMVPSPAGITSDEDRLFAASLYQNFRTNAFQYDMEEGSADITSDATADVENSEY